MVCVEYCRAKQFTGKILVFIVFIFRKKLLIFFAFLGSVMTIGLAFIAMGMWPMAIFFYIVATIGFSGANTLYDSLLPSVASEKKIDFVSSLGYGLGYIGGGLLFLINVAMYIFPTAFGLEDGIEGVKASFITVGVWWMVFTIPLILFVKEPKGEKISLGVAVKDGFGQIGRTLKDLRNLKSIAWFLVGYWCYIDGVDTIIRMATDYGTALGFSATSLIIALLITQFVAFPAAIGYNFLGQKIGIRKALNIAIFAYIAIATLGYFMQTEIHFFILAMCIGLFQGGIQALSRSYYARLIPKEHSSQFYGFFNMLGKFAAIIGPLLVGVISVITGDQRNGIFSLFAKLPCCQENFRTQNSLIFAYAAVAKRMSKIQRAKSLSLPGKAAAERDSQGLSMVVIYADSLFIRLPARLARFFRSEILLAATRFAKRREFQKKRRVIPLPALWQQL